MFNFDLNRIFLWLPAVIIALAFHEYAHAKAADWLGDSTPRLQGRMTLNPFVHIDFLGFLLLLVAGFGWAKPVQVNPFNLKGDPRKSMMLVALAGPLMNLLVAFTGALILSLALSPSEIAAEFSYPLVSILRGIVIVNVYLAVFNLIPIPPLDGAKVLGGVVRSDELFFRLNVYGPVILLLLIFTGIIGRIILPLAGLMIGLIDKVAYLIASPISGLL